MVPRVSVILLASLGWMQAAGSPAAAEEMKYPLGIAVAEGGEVYLADRDLPGVWKIADGKQSLYFQGSKKFRTPLNAIRCLAIDKMGRLLAGDSATREVYRFDAEGKPVPLTQGGIGIPMSIGVNSQGELFVGDLELQRVWKVPAEGGKPEKFAEIPAARGVQVDDKDRVWVLSAVRKGKLYRLTPDGQSEVVIEDCNFEFPHNLVVRPDETVFVTDGYARAIWRIAPGQAPEKWVHGEPLVNPVGLTQQGDRLYVADPRANAVFTVDEEGKIAKFP